MCICIGRDESDDIVLKSFEINLNSITLKYKLNLQDTIIYYAKISDSGRILLINTDHGISFYKAPKFKLIA